MGIIINRYKDPYETTSIMESKRVFPWLNWLRNGLQYNRVGVHPHYKEVVEKRTVNTI